MFEFINKVTIIFIIPIIPNIFVLIDAVTKYIIINILNIFDIKYASESKMKCFDFTFFFINKSVINGKIVNIMNQNTLVKKLSFNILNNMKFL